MHNRLPYQGVSEALGLSGSKEFWHNPTLKRGYECGCNAKDIKSPKRPPSRYGVEARVLSGWRWPISPGRQPDREILDL
jgi:hypothetical protein